MIPVKALFFLCFVEHFKCDLIWNPSPEVVKTRKTIDLIRPKLANCFSKSDYRKRTFSNKNGFFLTPIITPTAKEKHVYKFTFSATKAISMSDATTFKVFDISRFINRRHMLYFTPYSISPGIYKIKMISSVSVTLETRNLHKSFDPLECYFMVQPLAPLVVLLGGIYRQVPPNEQFLLDARKTIDLNSNDQQSGINTLTFKWTCTQAEVSTFCKNEVMSTDRIMRIHKQHVVENGTFKVNLQVSSYNVFAHASQNIDVVEEAADLIIACVKNCPPQTDLPDTKQVTSFEVSCQKNCYHLKKEDVQWEVQSTTDFTINYDTQTQTGRKGMTFIILENVFKPAGEYNITATLTGKLPGKTTISLKFALSPVVKSCKTEPSTGISQETFFKLVCDVPQPDEGYIFEIFIGGNLREGIISGFYPVVFDYQFLLPWLEKEKFNVRVTKTGELPSYLDLEVGITPSKTIKSDEIKKLYDKFQHGEGESISSLLASDNSTLKQKGVKMFNILVNEIVAFEPTEETFTFAKNLTYTVVEEMLNSPPKNTLQLVVICDAIGTIVTHYMLTKSDPYLAKLSSAVCKLMVISYAKDFKKASFSQNSERQFNTIAGVLTKCMEANVYENFALLTARAYNISIETIPPSDKDHLQDYISYLDDIDEHQELIENYNALTNNILDAHAEQAKAVSLTLTPGSHIAKSPGNFSGLLVVKDSGEKLANTTIRLKDIFLIPSHDFRGSTYEFVVLINLWSKDIMWWNLKKSRVITDILSIQFWHGNGKKRMRHFRKPAILLMKINKQKHFQTIIITSNISVPQNYTAMSGKTLNRYIRVHRINIPPGAVLNINFYNISPYDTLDAVISKNQFPTIANFATNQTISSRQINYMRIMNTKRFAVWGYLALLPNKNSLIMDPGLMFYNVIFSTSYCIRWMREERSWKPTCTTGYATTSKTICCICNHFSVVAGYNQNAKSLIQEVLPMKIELKLEACLVIFITFAVTYLMFCLLTIPIAFARQNPVYFLADNKKEDTYAYLIIVRTEDKRSAGTTSNVTLKLLGSKANSDPHVLNYPDPNMYLLQRHCEDMFVLTTPESLGIIQKVELWYDCNGPSPSWACRDMVVFDMQTNNQWYFKIKTEFDINLGVTFLIVIPKDVVKSKKITSKFRICNHFHTWKLWGNEKNFSYLARLTVVFSNILTIFTLNLVIQNWLPRFVLRDCFDIHWSLLVPASAINACLFCALLSFIPHIILAWCFRFSNLEFFAFHKKFKQTYKLSLYCWIILCVSIFTSTSVLISHGFWVPYYKSLLWLITSVIAILFDVLILENVFILVQTFICRFKLTISIEKQKERYLQMIQIQRDYLYETFESTILRPYLVHLYKPLQKIQIIRRKIIVDLRRNIYNDMEDIFMYGIYNVLLYMVILLSRSTLTTTSREEIKSMVNGKYTRTMGFPDVEQVQGLYSYINETLIPVLHPTAWYDDYTLSIPGLMADTDNSFLGVVRIRQHRVKKGSCVVPEIMKFLNVTCIPGFSRSKIEYGRFGPNWTRFKETFQYDKFKSIWHYLDSEETETAFVAGRFSYYSGGGYVAYLGQSIATSMASLVKLMGTEWLDRQTRVVFLEFLIYNVNYNVFISVNLQYEKSAAGYTTQYADVNVVRMLMVENEMEQMTIVVCVIYIFWVVLLMLKLIIGIAKNVTDFYKKTWLMIDLLINSMTIVNIGTFIFRMKMINKYLEALEAVNNDQYVSYSDLFILEELMTYFGGVLICIATVRLWKFLRFGLFFQILEKTLTMAAFPLFSVTFAFSVILIAFGLSGVLIFGNEHPELSTLIRIITTLIQLSLKPDQFDLTNYLNAQLSYFYFASYLMLMQIILLVYITVIIMAYTKAKLELSVEPDSYTVNDYIREQLHHLPKLFKAKIHRLRGGDQAYSPITPKADEFRYANCLGIQQSRIESMSFIVSCIVRNINQSSEQKGELTEYEIDLMMRVCRAFVLKTFVEDDFELFFKGHLEGERVKLVDERRINKIADFVQAMFGKDEFENRFPFDPKYTRCCQISLQKIAILHTAGLRLKLMTMKLSAVKDVIL